MRKNQYSKYVPLLNFDYSKCTSKFWYIIFTFFLLIFQINFSFAQFNAKKSYEFIIKGKIVNQNLGLIKLDYINHKGEYVKDSVKVKNGYFSFKGTIPHPVEADIYGDIVSNSTSDVNFSSIFLEPGILNVLLEKDRFKEMKVKGSKTQSQIDSLYDSMPNKKIVDSLEKRLRYFEMHQSSDNSNKSYFDSIKFIRQLLDPYYKVNNSRNLEYIRKEVNSYYSIMRLNVYAHRLPLDTVKEIFNTYTKKIRESYYGERLSATIRSKEGGSPGSFAKDFSVKDINGNTVTLEQFKGKKFVLLDFWATWCKPCRAESPFLIDLYSKFKSKDLEIISIANDDERRQLWEKAIIEDKIGSWIHVLQGVGTPDDLGQKFGVQPIPMKILIGKDGKILMRSEGSDANKQLYDALSKNLK